MNEFITIDAIEEKAISLYNKEKKSFHLPWHEQKPNVRQLYRKIAQNSLEEGSHE